MQTQRFPLHRACMRLATALLVALLLAACNTTPQRPPPPPAPSPLPEPAALPPAQPQALPAPPPASAPPPSASTAGSYPAPRDDAAEVQVEEVPLDGSAAAPADAPSPAAPPPPRPQQELLAHMGIDGAAARDAGGGGAALPPGAPPPLPAPTTSPAAGNRLPTLPAADDELVGADIRLGGGAPPPPEVAASLQAMVARARAAANAERAAGAPSGVPDGQGGRADERVRGAGGAAATATGAGNLPDLSGERGSPTLAQAAVPRNLPDPRDDDILARQLREAASRERDPLLREKLWEEYRRYRAGIAR